MASDSARSGVARARRPIRLSYHRRVRIGWLLLLALLGCRGDDRQAPRLDEPKQAPVHDAIPIDAPAIAPRYTIVFPAPSQTRNTTVQTTAGPMPQQVESAELAGTTYLVVSGTMPPGLPDQNKAGGQDRVLAMFGAKATRDVAIKLGDADGREVRFTGTASGTLRTFAIGTWMIQAGVVVRSGKLDDQKAQRFLDSLQLQR
jgi:hypothetical protein